LLLNGIRIPVEVQVDPLLIAFITYLVLVPTPCITQRIGHSFKELMGHQDDLLI
jgi:hypothetical protein